MAVYERTNRGIEYNTDGNDDADVLRDMQHLAETTDSAINNAVQEATYDDTALKARVTTNEGDIADIKSEQTTQNANIQTNANAIQTLQGTVTAQGQTIENLGNNKVDKEQGKGLSEEDYTTPEKTKLAGIEAEANKTIVDSSLDDTSTNPVQNKVIYESQEEQNAEIEVLQQDVEDLRGACLSVEGTGTDITLNNTAQARLLKNDLSGRTEQEQLSGKNLFNKYGEFNSGFGRANAISILENGQLKTIANWGASRAKGQLINVQANTNYTISGILISADGTRDNNAVYEVLNSTGTTAIVTAFIQKSVTKPYSWSRTFNTGENTQIIVSLSGWDNDTSKLTNTIFDNIQLEQGSTATSYEPYCRTEYQHQILSIKYQLKM